MENSEENIGEGEKIEGNVIPKIKVPLQKLIETKTSFSGQPNSKLTKLQQRKKIALAPGHSQLDWMRLQKSGRDLAGTNGIIIKVTLDELKKHKSPDDIWLAIRGKVFNVTHYMDFHPGGKEELMKGAGKDATLLFDKKHPWVNYEAMMIKCLIGHLVNE